MPPPPKHPSQRRRTNPTVPMTRLPASGYSGPVPAWPLPTADTRERKARESELWFELWNTPMAAAWARLGWAREVALYARFFAQAETGDLKAAGECRLMSDRLGLNPIALLKLRWEIVDDESGQVLNLPATGTGGPQPSGSARGRAAALGIRPVAADEDPADDADDE